MNALVTGGAGFIGSSIARSLMHRGWAVRVLDNFLTGFEENVPEGAELVRGDVRDLDAVRDACRGIDVVFHHAALRYVHRSVEDPMLNEECNSIGTLNVLLGAEDGGARKVVYASSSAVYGDLPHPVQHEDMAPDPISPYGVSKLTGEHYCRVWTYLGRMPTVSLRYFNVFGPGQHPESKYAAVFPAFVHALVAGDAPEVHWDGDQSRDFVYIDDVVEANVRAAEAGPQADGAFMNIGGGTARTVNEVLRAVADVVGRWVEPVYGEKRPGDVRRTQADITRARDVLGWTPDADWRRAVESTVRWFVEKRPPVR